MSYTIVESGDSEQMVSKSVWEIIISWVITLLLAFFPLIWALMLHLDLGQEVTSSYLNGLITASGVFVGFLSAAVISKAKDLSFYSYSLASFALLIFFIAMVSLSNDLATKSYATLSDLLAVESSLILSGLTAWNIMQSLFRKSHSKQTTQKA